MYIARFCVRTLVFTIIVCASCKIPPATAQEVETISIEQREAARRSFEQGEVAYESGDFVLAAKAFEQAYHTAPHHAPLWNAARAWERAGEPARAANAYAKYLRSAPPDAPDRDAASVALEHLGKKLGRIEVHATDIDIVLIDDEVVDFGSVYVHPGKHLIEGQMNGTKVRRTEVLEEGEVRSVVLVEEPKRIETDVSVPSSIGRKIDPVVPKSISASAARPNPIPTVNRTHGWLGPAAIVAGGVTVGAVSLALWSGVDTLTARDEFIAAPSNGKLERGKDKQLRTNVLLGGAIGSALVTGALISVWKWNDSRMEATVSVLPMVAGLPMQVVVAGSF